MTLRRVAILGMNNPMTPDRRRALWPAPVGCAGWNLWKLTHARTGCTEMDYVRAFHRYNLVERGQWDTEVARWRWERIEVDLAENFDTIVLLGASVRRAVLPISLRAQLPPELYISRGLICLPHPSGLNRWYNAPRNRALAETIMEELYWEATRAPGISPPCESSFPIPTSG